MSIGAILRAGLGGYQAASESRDTRMRALLAAEQERRKAQDTQAVQTAQRRKYEQDAEYDAQDRLIKEADRAKRETADRAEQAAREANRPTQVRMMRADQRYKDLSDIEIQNLLAETPDLFKDAIKPESPRNPIVGTPEWAAAEHMSAQIRAQYAAPPAPRNIDPLSPQGIAARRQLESGTETTTLPDGTVVQGKPPKTTEGQGKASVNASVAEAEESAISAMSNSLPNKYTAKIPVVGNILSGKRNPEFQAQKAAGDRWVNQYLRFQSGAAISETEFESARNQFIPQPGDTPATVQAKAEARRRVVEGIKSAAGPASPGQAPAQNNAGSGDRAARLRAKYGVK